MINPLTYDHAGYIATAYGLFAATTVYFALSARLRLASAARRLRAADPRAQSRNAQSRNAQSRNAQTRA